MIHPLKAGRQILLINSIRMPITVPSTRRFNDHLLNEQMPPMPTVDGALTVHPTLYMAPWSRYHDVTL